jgi:hypothetical protein
MNKKTDSVAEFDFGFSFVDEEYEEVKNFAAKTKEGLDISKVEVDDLHKRVDLLYNTIVPFLDNLCKNPEKSTILWPNRVDKIQQYKSRLKQIAEGKHNT